MKFTITDLPAVGKKMTMINNENQMMVMIVHHSGKRDLYFYEDPDDDEAVFSYALSAEETKQLGSQLLGAITPEEGESRERLQLFRKKVMVEWIDVTKKSPFAGKTFKELQVKSPVGLSILGIVRNDDILVHPEDDSIIEINDTIMIVGKPEPIMQFMQLFEGERG
ncbi:cation:proton antiporter regulatory subunit [Paenibacillus senegalensis]|uniref:cation:proton antiporter regulatory subunit n=1 Tax=Paenibacillus senegalensis TaxID=1465766 RepID=UPI0002891201|nr:TrkA C-terminal domain-containing protein [Paenibacillus senegalensis]